MTAKSIGRFIAVLALPVLAASAGAAPLPTPAVDIPAASVKGQQTEVFAGGCFWGVEAVFRHVKGATRAVSGYAGGMIVKPSYEQVGTGRTGHAESVEVIYDPAHVSYGQPSEAVHRGGEGDRHGGAVPRYCWPVAQLGGQVEGLGTRTSAASADSCQLRSEERR